MKMRFSRLIEQREACREKERKRALREARRLSTILAESFPFRRLYLFGSVLKKGGFGPASDIDLAVEGLPDDAYLKAYGFLIRRSNFPLDLKPWELLDPALKDLVRAEGKILYEK